MTIVYFPHVRSVPRRSGPFLSSFEGPAHVNGGGPVGPFPLPGASVPPFSKSPVSSVAGGAADRAFPVATQRG